jgi:hypothetical protein
LLPGTGRQSGRIQNRESHDRQESGAFGVDWTRTALANAQIGEEAREPILTRNAAAMIARVADKQRARAAA